MPSSNAVKSLFDDLDTPPEAATQAPTAAPATQATVTNLFETVMTPMADLFKCRENRVPKGSVPIRVQRSMFVPAEKNYLFDADNLKWLILWIMGIGSKNMYIGGPRGCGKTTMFEQLCARIGWPVFRLGCHGGIEDVHMRGQWILTVENGVQVTKFTDGPLIQAMRQGGVFLMDEGDSLNPTVLLGLNTVLDGGPVLIPETGELVVPHANFRIAMTGNTMLDGGMGKYKGTVRQNEAVADRFFKIKADYMPWAEEALVVKTAVPKLPTRLVEGLVKMARDMRLAVKGDGTDKGHRCELDISTRGLIRAGAALVCFMDPKTGTVSKADVETCLRVSIFESARFEDQALAMELAQRSGLFEADAGATK